jgi:hypothetical protein
MFASSSASVSLVTMTAIMSQGCPMVQKKRRTNPTKPRGIIGRMDAPNLRAILAANLKRLIEHETPEGEKYSVRAWALRKELDVRLIDRLTKGEHAVTLDKLQEIADACELQPWHLLLEDFNPAAPPDDAPITVQERTLLQRLRKLLGG